MSLVRIAHNAVTAKLIDAPKEVKLLVSTLLSYRVEGAEHMASFKSNNWDGRSTFFDYKTGTFPAGFVNSIHSSLVKARYMVQLVRKPFPKPLGTLNPKVDDFPYDPNYDYQAETVSKLLKYGQMVAQIATGGGKSRVAKLVYATIKRPTLFLTTRGVLMHQMKDAFANDLGANVGVIGEGNWKPTRGINVAMVQTIAPFLDKMTAEGEVERKLNAKYKSDQKAILELKANLKKKKANFADINNAVGDLRTQLKKKDTPRDALLKKAREKTKLHNEKRLKVIKLLEMFEVVILEEAHEISGNGFFDILRHCKNAHYRLALTATPFMSDDEEANKRLMASSGVVGIRVTEKMLIDKGILARPIFKFINVEQPNEKLHPNYNKLRRSTPWQRAYKYGIAENEARNAHIVSEVVRAKKHGLTSMVLVQHTAHGDTLKKMMKKMDLNVEFIWGKHEQKERKAALEKLKSGEIDVLIGSTILDVGVDVPAVGMIVNAGGGKAETALRQRVGRGLRKKTSGPNICLVIDFTDARNSHLNTHAKQRRAIISSTEGFGENILDKGVDFNYKELGLAS